MPITGGVKFFDRSNCLAMDGTTAVASTGNASGLRALDRNPVTYWRTVGSNDATTETFEVTFTEAKTINRVFLVDHNFKDFMVQYDVAGVWTDFTSVVGVDGALTGIQQTGYSKDTSYYEVAQVSTNKVLLTITTTQGVDAEKYLNQLIVTSELGTLVGYPGIAGSEFSKNLRVQKMLSGRALIMKSDEFFQMDLRFQDYPSSLSADIDLMFSLHDRDDNFLVWPCGGRYGSAYFRKTLRGFRLRDVMAMQVDSSIKPSYSKNIYTGQVNFTVSLSEDVQ